LPKKNLWTKLYSAVADLESKRDFSEQMELPATMALDTLMHNIVARQPHGHVEYDPKGYYAVGTVSERIGHTPIEDGWRTSVEPVGNRVRTQVKNISEHIKAVVLGAEVHLIPDTAPHVFFWWGKPQRWPAKAETGPGYYKFPVVIHPGQQANPFPADAVSESIPDMKETIKVGVGDWIRNLMSRYGLGEK
jgi:hypothetical protein